MTSNIKVGLIGAAGYTGSELIRLLLQHPNVDIIFLGSRSQSGKPIASILKDLEGETDLIFSNPTTIENIDVLFLCLGHGEAKAYLEQTPINPSIKIIDLSQDFRLSNEIPDRVFTYGLPEFQKSAIQRASNISNPGCFATAIQLALLPLSYHKLLSNDVHITGITGATGAGQKPQASSHFPWRSNNIQAYKSLCHQHLHEIKATLSALQETLPNIHFIPWRGDFARGIYITAYTQCSSSKTEIKSLFAAFYKDHPFVHISDESMDMKQVINTNKCILQIEKEGDQIIIHAAIDNLLKGASGQALQNMNLLFGLPEHTGLKLKSIAF